MAMKENQSIRSLTLYSIYLRNHGEWNTFQKLQRDLPRIKSMGFDAIWLMPIHPIGITNRKGELGCPYSIKDYEGINPEYGTEEELKELIDVAHEHGLKVLIDVVYNHTSHDSRLWNSHPGFFLQDEQGKAVCKEPEWSDVIDLDYTNLDLWPVLIDALKKWSSLGVDGYRCDVASLVPVSFWLKAREEISKMNPNTIWLAESVHKHFIKAMRSKGYEIADDATLYQAFDILYDYDIHPQFEGFVSGELTLSEFIEEIKTQDLIYPLHYIKLRFIENHDQPRFSSLRSDWREKETFTVLSYLLKGATLVYAGQETMDTHTPSLFELDPIHFDQIEPAYVDLLTKLNALVKDSIFRSNQVHYEVISDQILLIRYENDQVIAILNFGKETAQVPIRLAGSYEEILSGIRLNEVETVQVGSPVIYRKTTY